MIKIMDNIININHYPDGTMLLKKEFDIAEDKPVNITWNYENDTELIALFYLTRKLQSQGAGNIRLIMPYIPNARMDRVKNEEDIFTLKYFSEIINSLGFSQVVVLDPHSNVSEALIDHIKVRTPKPYIEKVIQEIYKQDDSQDLVMFYPDEGACKRYSNMFFLPYSFGIKKRDWKTGKILGLDVVGAEHVKEKRVLIVDDISSKGGTFYYSAQKLKELGAKDIYLYITHCENTILDGKLIGSGLLKKIYTTDSIFTKQHEMITVMSCEEKGEDLYD